MGRSETKRVIGTKRTSPLRTPCIPQSLRDLLRFARQMRTAIGSHNSICIWSHPARRAFYFIGNSRGISYEMKKVQKSPSHKIQCDGLFCQNAMASSSLPKGRPVAGSTGGRPACPISAAFTLHTTALASTYFTFAVAAAPILS